MNRLLFGLFYNKHNAIPKYDTVIILYFGKIVLLLKRDYYCLQYFLHYFIPSVALKKVSFSTVHLFLFIWIKIYLHLYFSHLLITSLTRDQNFCLSRIIEHVVVPRICQTNHMHYSYCLIIIWIHGCPCNNVFF